MTVDDTLTHAEKDEVHAEKGTLWMTGLAAALIADGSAVTWLEGYPELVGHLLAVPLVTWCAWRCGYHSGWRLYHLQDTIDMMKLLDRWRRQP